MHYFLFDWNLCSYLKVGRRSLLLEVGCGFISLLCWEFSKASAAKYLLARGTRVTALFFLLKVIEAKVGTSLRFSPCWY